MDGWGTTLDSMKCSLFEATLFFKYLNNMGLVYRVYWVAQITKKTERYKRSGKVDYHCTPSSQNCGCIW